MAASDGIKQRKVVHQVTSALTGPVTVDDVVYEKVDDEFARLFPLKDLIFRRLTFERSKGLVQSEALLTRAGSQDIVGEKQQKRTRPSSKSKKRSSRKKHDSNVTLMDDSSNGLIVDHDHLASSYHTGIISGFMLISSHLENRASTGTMVKAVVIGLGAGLLPMFLHGCLPFLHIEVVELDPAVLDIAKDYFGFREDEHLKVHITDGVQFVRDGANSEAAFEVTASDENKNVSSSGSCTVSHADGPEREKVGILIVDVDSSDSSSGMTCPAADFVEESFLFAAKSSLSQEGLFIINLVARSPAIKDAVVSRMKRVFSNLFSLQLEEDVNEVIFALNTTEVGFNEDIFPLASSQLDKLLNLKHPERSQTIIDAAKKIKRLK